MHDGHESPSSAPRIWVLTAMLAALPLTGAAGLGGGPVASYPFDGDANDTSGNGTHGTVDGPVLTTDRLGESDAAYAFDGVDDRISAPADPSLDITDEVTITAWVRPLETKTQIIVRKGGGTLAPYALALAGNGTIVFALGIDGGYAGLTKQGYALDAWTFLAATWDGATMRIYENGEEVASGAQSGTMDINTSSLLIGTRLQLVADTFLGTIDEVGIWSRALSPAEIETVMQGGSTPIEAMSWGNLKARFGH